MITGDNHLTALAIGLECNILTPKKDIYILNYVEEKDKNPFFLMKYNLPDEEDKD